MRAKAAFLTAIGAMLAVLVLAPSSLFAQNRSSWRTAADIRTGSQGTISGTVVSLTTEGFRITTDDDLTGTEVRVDTTGSTRYGGVLPGGESIVSGDAGLRELRIGDRVRVTGSATSASTVRATDVMLIGRSVSAAPRAGTQPGNELDGIIRDIRIRDRSFVLEADDGTRTTIVGTDETPVRFEGQTYSLRNLEVGDRVRVVVDTRLSSGGVRAREIQVLVDSTPDVAGGIRSQNYVTGRVERIDTRANRITVNADRVGQVRVELSKAVGAGGRQFRATDVQVGDRVRVWGAYTGTNVFRAERVEFGSADDAYQDDEFRDQGQEPFEGFSTVVFYGVIERNETAEDRLRIRDRENDRDVEIVVDEEFVVLREAGSFVRAAELRQGDNVVVKAFRDARGNYIAQTIRLR